VSASDAETVLDPGAIERLDRIGGREFILEMIDLFLEHSPQRLSAGRAAFEGDDMAGVYRAAHSLKSTSANLGARALQSTAEQAESRAAAEDREALAPLLDDMERHFQRVRLELIAERGRREGTAT
jgi:two-component system, sensor histidine kinase and response regulator